MNSSITLDEVTKIMASGETFSVRFVKFDAKRKIGGQIREFKSVVGSLNSSKQLNPTGVPSKRAQNHFDNMTRNVFIVLGGYATETAKKIHLNLILEVNGRKLIL